MCGTRGRGTRGEKISMVGGKTNDDIFATNVRPKEKKKQVKQKKKKKKRNIPALPSSTSRAAFRVGGGRTRKAQHAQDAHTRGTIGEAEGRRYRGRSIYSGVVCKVVEE